MIIPRFIAHRGANQLAPENTLKAFQLAEDLGAKMFECDVLLSQDQVPVIFHDDHLERCTNGHGAIRNTPYSLLKTLDAGEGEIIPSLTQLLTWLQNSKMQMNLELKYPTNTAAAQPLIEKACLPLLDLQDRILVSSFNLDALYTVRQTLPDITIGLLIDKENFKKHGFTGIEKYYNSLHAFSIHCDRHLLSLQHIHAFLKISPYLLAYTVNNPEEAKDLFQQGVTAVFSDIPMSY